MKPENVMVWGLVQPQRIHFHLHNKPSMFKFYFFMEERQSSKNLPA